MSNEKQLKKTYWDYKSEIFIYLACCASLFHLYNLGISMMNMWQYRLLHVCFAAILVFFSQPLLKKEKHKVLDEVLNYLCIAVVILVAAYIIINRTRLEMYMSFAATKMDAFICVLGVLMVLEFTRRANGAAMPILALVFVAYAMLGHYIPGLLGHGGYSLQRIATYLFSVDGIFGTSVGTSATYVILFVIFGSVLEGTGGGRLFIDAAIRGLGMFRGGPAKAAVVSSALMGMISGSSAANVVTTGAFTIPLMKEVGYRKDFAGSVEAVASTGGQIMPPIMGAGAFLMAEALGVPYMEVAKAAVIPAIMYFGSVFISVDLEAVKTGLRGMKKEELPNLKATFATYGLLMIPLVTLISMLVFTNYSVIRACLVCTLMCLVLALVRKGTRYNVRGFIEIMAGGMKDSLGVIAACACAGIVVGILTMTGLGNKLVTVILQVANGHLILALFLVMIVTIILGMGLPTTASYIVCSSVVVPALIKMGLEPLPAHMFVFYFACLSAVTPPVAIAAYAAAGISGGDVNKTGWTAFRLALVAFIIPYMFVYSNALLMMGDGLTVVRSLLTACVGVYLFSSGMSGWYVHRTSWVIRVALLVASLLLIDQGAITDVIGFAMAVVIWLFQKFMDKGKNDEAFRAKMANINSEERKKDEEEKAKEHHLQ